jgi:HAD superfamily hydrolase (TIGR01509 family)
MDGLLLDTEVLWQRAEEQLFARHGAVFTMADKLQVIGTPLGRASRVFARRLGLPDTTAADLGRELIALMRAELRSQVASRPGAVELVRRLRDDGIRLGLASNSNRDLVDLSLSAAGVSDAFDVIVSSDDVANPKPAPDLYLLACERLGVPPHEAIALEDSTSGVAAAKAAGLACIAVPQYAETDVSAADRIVDSLERLLEPR